jgi:hypothetical protein
MAKICHATRASKCERFSLNHWFPSWNARIEKHCQIDLLEYGKKILAIPLAYKYNAEEIYRS